MGWGQIGPATLVGSCSFCFLLLISRAGTNSRANSQGDTDKKGEKSHKLGRSAVLQMDKAHENKYSGTFVGGKKNLRKRKNMMNARFWGEKSQVRISFMRREKIW